MIKLDVALKPVNINGLLPDLFSNSLADKTMRQKILVIRIRWNTTLTLTVVRIHWNSYWIRRHVHWIHKHVIWIHANIKRSFSWNAGLICWILDCIHLKMFRIEEEVERIHRIVATPRRRNSTGC